MKNRYSKSSKLSEAKFRLIIKCFALDLTATQTAEMVGVSRNSISLLFSAIRHRIAENSRLESPLSGEFEADESYFGATRVKGKRGRSVCLLRKHALRAPPILAVLGAGRKQIVFGLLKRDGNVYVQVVPNAKAATLQPIIPEGDILPYKSKKGYFRLRVGDYRIIFTWISDKQISIASIDPRGGAYK